MAVLLTPKNKGPLNFNVIFAVIWRYYNFCTKNTINLKYYQFFHRVIPKFHYYINYHSKATGFSFFHYFYKFSLQHLLNHKCYGIR